jgi:hypothetical protein
VNRAVRAVVSGATLVVAPAAAGACGSSNPDDSPFNRVRHPASWAEDSARAVVLATKALGDSLPMRVAGVSKGAEGWQVRLLPVRGGTVGGGLVWVEVADSSATVVKRY